MEQVHDEAYDPKLAVDPTVGKARLPLHTHVEKLVDGNSTGRLGP